MIGVVILGAWAITQARSFAVPVAAALAGLFLTVLISRNYAAEEFRYARRAR